MKSLPSRIISSSRVRLSLTYLSIIMILSLGFSSVFYLQSVNEAKGNLNRQAFQLRDYLYFATPEDIQKVQDRQLTLFRKNLLDRLAILNAGMFLLGGSVSLLLARRSLRPLEQALESQSRFTSDAAHELRTPLTAMKTEIEVALRSKVLKTSDAKEVLNSSLEEISKLETLTAALLRLARDTEKTDKTHWLDYKLSEILDSSYDRLADKAKSNNVNIVIPKTKATVFGDPDQLVELFVTLLGNAIKYSPSGSEVRLKVSRLGDSRLAIDIIDEGIGITEVDLPHIFERFYRADQSRNKSKVDGYGLGLSLAKSIAELHGGKITVKSKFQEGSTFTVCLPIK